MSGTSEFRVDREKNRLSIKLSGFFRSADVPKAMATLEVDAVVNAADETLPVAFGSTIRPAPETAPASISGGHGDP